jgi:hypothetical protein
MINKSYSYDTTFNNISLCSVSLFYWSKNPEYREKNFRKSLTDCYQIILYQVHLVTKGRESNSQLKWE